MRLSGALLPDEHVLVSTRSHESIMLPAVFCGFIAVVAYSFASAIYGNSAFFGVIGYLLAVIFGWIALRRLWRWMMTGFIITSSRLVIQRGLGGRRSVSLPLESIEGVDVRNALVRTGESAYLRVHARGTVHVLRQIPRGKDFSLQIQEAQSTLIRQRFSSAGFSPDASPRYGYQGRSYTL